MIVIADAGLPQTVEHARTPNLQLVRWSSSSLVDAALLEDAFRSEFQGVIFLGTRAVLAAPVIHHRRRSSLWIAGTSSEDPFEAQRAVGNNIASIERGLQAGRIVEILAKEVRILTSLRPGEGTL